MDEADAGFVTLETLNEAEPVLPEAPRHVVKRGKVKVVRQKAPTPAPQAEAQDEEGDDEDDGINAYGGRVDVRTDGDDIVAVEARPSRASLRAEPDIGVKWVTDGLTARLRFVVADEADQLARDASLALLHDHLRKLGNDSEWEKAGAAAAAASVEAAGLADGVEAICALPARGKVLPGIIDLVANSVETYERALATAWRGEGGMAPTAFITSATILSNPDGREARVAKMRRRVKRNPVQGAAPSRLPGAVDGDAVGAVARKVLGALCLQGPYEAVTSSALRVPQRLEEAEAKQIADQNVQHALIRAMPNAKPRWLVYLALAYASGRDNWAAGMDDKELTADAATKRARADDEPEKAKDGRTIVFVNATASCEPTARLLRAAGMPRVAAVHAKMPQRKRLQAIDMLRNHGDAVIVTTDLLSRGIDIPVVRYVINYHAPSTAETLIHRAGRTGRVGRPGTVFHVVSPAEMVDFQKAIQLSAVSPTALTTVAHVQRCSDAVADDAVAMLSAQVSAERLHGRLKGKSWAERTAGEADCVLPDEMNTKLEFEGDNGLDATADAKSALKKLKAQVSTLRARVRAAVDKGARESRAKFTHGGAAAARRVITASQHRSASKFRVQDPAGTEP